MLSISDVFVYQFYEILKICSTNITG